VGAVYHLRPDKKYCENGKTPHPIGRIDSQEPPPEEPPSFAGSTKVTHAHCGNNEAADDEIEIDSGHAILASAGCDAWSSKVIAFEPEQVARHNSNCSDAS
jgi:hypothetical protein